MRNSIEDVASHAGVSITTVSRVINNSSHRVSEKTREKVLQAIKELNYQPNAAAQNLKANYTNVLAFICRNLADPYYGEICRGVSEISLQNNILTFACNTGHNFNHEQNYHNLFAEHKVRGLILSGGGYDTKEYQSLILKEINEYAKTGRQIVALAPQGPKLDPLMHTIMINNIQTSYRNTEYLIQQGHTNIAYIGGPKEIFTAKERLEGYLKALRDYKIQPNSNQIFYASNFWQEGYEFAQQAVQNNRKCTAIYCANDNIAISAMNGCLDLGLKIPEDISFISIGGLPDNSYMMPKLTTAAIPLYELGTKAVELILSNPTEKTHITLEAPIIPACIIKKI